MIHHRHKGSGPALVLLHGLFGSLENLAGIAGPLSEHFSVYSCDLPNHGRSAHTDKTCLASMAESLRLWLEDQRLEQVAFLGHSLGGKVAMELALRYPECITRLVVLDIAPINYTARHGAVFDGLLSLNLSEISSRREADTQLAEYLPESELRGFLLKNLYKHEQLGLQWRMNLPVIYRDYPELIGANSHGSVYPADVLFIKGENSDYIREPYREEILGRFPRAQIRVVSDTGHWLHAQKPAIVTSIARKFLLSE